MRNESIRRSDYSTASCQGTFGNYLVLSSLYPDTMIVTFDDAFESVAKELITRTVGAL